MDHLMVGVFWKNGPLVFGEKKSVATKTQGFPRWWFQIFFFSPLFGEDEPNLTSIFFKGVEATN